jgi:hypothetical protein
LAAGAALGLGPGFHNGLFILQAFYVAHFLVLWVRDMARPVPATVMFSIGLCSASLLVLSRSEPFLNGHFSFYLLSWFHLFSAGATSIVCIMAAVLARRVWSGMVLAAFVVLMFIIAGTEIRHGTDFLFSQFIKLDVIGEARGVSEMLLTGATGALTEYYSGLIWLLPLVILMQLRQLFSTQAPHLILFAVYVVLGVAIGVQQLRLHYFFSFALYVPLLAAAEAFCGRATAWHRRTLMLAAVVTMIAYLPVLPRLTKSPPPGMHSDYAIVRSIYPLIAEQCRKQPGVILADYNDGHYLRFHTDCDVIANNFVMSPIHFEKIALSDRLLSSSTATLLDERYAWIDYVYVRRDDNILATVDADEIRRANRGLRGELLFNPVPPDGFEIIGEVSARDPAATHPIIARAFRIRR